MNEPSSTRASPPRPEREPAPAALAAATPFELIRRLLDAAMVKVPATKYALAVAAIGGAAFLVLQFVPDPKAAFLVVLGMIVLMVVVRVFAVLSERSRELLPAAVIFFYACTAMAIAIVALLASSYLLSWPFIPGVTPELEKAPSEASGGGPADPLVRGREASRELPGAGGQPARGPSLSTEVDSPRTPVPPKEHSTRKTAEQAAPAALGELVTPDQPPKDCPRVSVTRIEKGVLFKCKCNGGTVSTLGVNERWDLVATTLLEKCDALGARRSTQLAPGR
jgi:hypothetical protein